MVEESVRTPDASELTERFSVEPKMFSQNVGMMTNSDVHLTTPKGVRFVD